ncbi:hypothetical protein F4811DRAFT_546629 [Daldinia bambusicola]|nr:hypothetical protein F4811DRAFT_546629 [Daldinia bambusicola]
MPWNRTKRATCIAIATALISLSDTYAFIGSQMTFGGEDIYSNRSLLCVMLILSLSASGATYGLHMLLEQANSWMSSHRAEPPTSWLFGLVRLDDEFRDLDHTFEFPE